MSHPAESGSPTTMLCLGVEISRIQFQKEKKKTSESFAFWFQQLIPTLPQPLSRDMSQLPSRFLIRFFYVPERGNNFVASDLQTAWKECARHFPQASLALWCKQWLLVIGKREPS